jgi:hypothetical protein
MAHASEFDIFWHLHAHIAIPLRHEMEGGLPYASFRD